MSEILEKVFGKGCLLNIHISRWTGSRKLQAEDLGLAKNEVPASFSLGWKKMIPAEAISEMRHWDYLARLCVEKHSFPFPFGDCRFVARTQLDDCVEQLDKIIASFNAAADRIVASYKRYRIEMRAEFLRAAQEAYRRRATLCGGLDTPEDKFVNQFLARIDKAYPKEEDLRAKYSMSYVVFQVSLPDITRATYADIAQDSERIHLMRESFELSLRQRMDKFVTDTATGLREEADDALSRMAKTLRGNGRVTRATLDIALNMIDRYERMDVFEDTAYKNALRDFRTRVLGMYDAKQISDDKGLRSNVVKELEALAEMARDSTSITKLVEHCRQQICL
jgi:hypothetical protein